MSRIDVTRCEKNNMHAFNISCKITCKVVDGKRERELDVSMLHENCIVKTLHWLLLQTNRCKTNFSVENIDKICIKFKYELIVAKETTKVGRKKHGRHEI